MLDRRRTRAPNLDSKIRESVRPRKSVACRRSVGSEPATGHVGFHDSHSGAVGCGFGHDRRGCMAPRRYCTFTTRPVDPSKHLGAVRHIAHVAADLHARRGDVAHVSRVHPGLVDSRPQRTAQGCPQESVGQAVPFLPPAMPEQQMCGLVGYHPGEFVIAAD